MSVLEIDSLRVSLPGAGGEVSLVDGVSMSVDEGQLVGIAGESGSGKTVTALAALGFLPPRARVSGSIRLDGDDVLAMTPRQLRAVRGEGIAMVFQDPMTSLHPMLNIEVQLTEQLHAHENITRAAARSRAVELLELVRIPDPGHALSAYPHHFSGGMRQRIAIASALACNPRVLIADEVTTALDVTVQAGILSLLDQLRRDTGMAVVFITHDLGVMNVTTDELYVMYAGRVVEQGDTRDVLAQPRHPYTRALVDSLPTDENLGAPLTVIPGEAVQAGRRPGGCAFHPRCTFARPDCRSVVPQLAPVVPDDSAEPRAVACHVDPFVGAASSEGTRS